MFKKIIISTLSFLLSLNLLYSQQGEMLHARDYFYSQKLGYFSIFTQKTENSDSLKLNVFVKIPRNNYLFLQTSEGEYRAYSQMEFSFSDNEGVVRYHKIIRDTMKAFTTYQPSDEFDFTYNFFTLNLLEKKYNLTIRTIDINSKKTDITNIDYIHYSKENANFFSYIFLEFNEKVNREDVRVLNNNLPFSSKNIKMMFNIPNSFKYNQIRYTIQRMSKNPNDLWKTEVKLEGRLSTVSSFPQFDYGKRSNFPPILSTNEGEGTVAADYSNVVDYYELNLDGRKLVPGKYFLTIHLTRDDSIVSKFEVIWDDEPLTLQSQKMYLTISKDFLTEKEIDAIEDGDRAKQFNNFIQTWQKFNPDQESFYNEALMTYYKRADYSFFNFSTSKDIDAIPFTSKWSTRQES